MLDLQEIVDKWGQVYTPEGQTDKSIRTQLFEPSRTDNFFTPIPIEGDHYKSAYATVDKVLQAFSIPFTNNGTDTYKPCELGLGEFKIDKLLYPDEVRHTWLGFWKKLEEADRSKWPMIKWAIQKLYIPKSKDEYEKQVAYRGWKYTGFNSDDLSRVVDGATLVRELKSASNPNGLPANASMDGIWVQIVRNIARINVVATGALNADDALFCTQIEDWVDAIDPALAAELDYIFMSEANYKRYRRGRRAKYNVNYEQAEDVTLVEDSHIKVNWLRGMDGANKIWATPSWNRINPYNLNKPGRFDTQKLDRSVKLLTDWEKAIGFNVPEYMVTNDLENTITAGDITTYYTEA